MLTVGEMTGNYAMLVPAMLAVGISYVIVGRHTIYESQVESPAQSPAHKYEYSFPLLRRLKVQDAMTSPVISVPVGTKIEEVQRLLHDHGIKSVPVTDHTGDGHILGIVTLEDILKTNGDRGGKATVANIMSTNIVATTPGDSLDTALELMTRHDVATLPVMEAGSDGKLVGMLSRQDISRVYTQTAKRLLGRTPPE
jgi:CIC family chloride channel protein